MLSSCGKPAVQRCSGCASATSSRFYCSRACQKLDWKTHKRECAGRQKENKGRGGSTAKKASRKTRQQAQAQPAFGGGAARSGWSSDDSDDERAARRAAEWAEMEAAMARATKRAAAAFDPSVPLPWMDKEALAAVEQWHYRHFILFDAAECKFTPRDEVLVLPIRGAYSTAVDRDGCRQCRGSTSCKHVDAWRAYLAILPPATAVKPEMVLELLGRARYAPDGRLYHVPNLERVEGAAAWAAFQRASAPLTSGGAASPMQMMMQRMQGTSDDMYTIHQFKQFLPQGWVHPTHGWRVERA